jgi:alkanesulfonate monooxygenase SsuD/methylene tetrahydromethanopterin reductase-like flavin-dependent oxidoreductase (luciferase family)
LFRKSFLALLWVEFLEFGGARAQGGAIIGKNGAEVKSKVQSAVKRGEVGSLDIESHSIVGTPEQCIQRIGEYVDIGVDRFMLSFPESATDVSGLRLFGKKVLPSFK